MWEVKKNSIVYNLNAKDKQILLDMGIPEDFNLSDSFIKFLQEEKINLNQEYYYCVP